jgi:hypothetical protein
MGVAAILSCYLFIWLVSENYAEELIKELFMMEGALAIRAAREVRLE